MNQFFPNPNLQNTASISDLAETFHTEFNKLRQQACTINNALNSYVQIARMQNPNDFQDILSNLGLSSENVSQMHKMDSRFSRINDIIEEIVQSHFYEHTSLSSKYEMELEECRKELSNYREANIDFRTKYEQEKTHWSLEKQALEEKVRGLSKELDESRAALVENITSSANEERVNKKKMEMWFKRRLDAVEHRIVELKEAPQDERKFEELLRKVRGLKKKQPWNVDKKRPNLMLDDAVLNQRSEVYSNGTSTPYSHYVGVLSSAATENNLLDKGFVCSVNNSFPATHRSQNSFLSEPPSTGMKDTKQRLLESAVRRLHDSRVSFSEKERLFCDVFKGTPSRNDALMHVKLDDILNAENISKSVDSLSLDLKSNGKPKYTFMFNQKMRLDELKDTKLEKAISTIQSQGSQKSSDMFGSFKRSKSFDGSQAILTNLEQLMELNITNGEKQEPPSAIDQGIIQEMSIIPKSLKGDKSMKSLFVEENTLKLEEMDSNLIKLTEYKEKKGGSSRFEEQLVNNSSLVDDDFKLFLGGQKNEVESKPFKRSSKDLKSSGKGLTINSKENSHNALEKLLNNLDLGSQKIVRASGRNMERGEKTDDILWSDAISKNHNDKKAEEKNTLKLRVDELPRKITEENGEKRPVLTINIEEKVHPETPSLSRASIKISGQEIQESNPILEGGYTPQRSHETSIISQFRPPSNGKHRHLRSSLSLVENIKEKLSRMNERKSHKYRHSQQFSSIMQDMSIDGDHHEQNESKLKTKNRSGSNFNQSLDCKSLSFSIEQEQKFAQPPRAQFQTKMNSLLGRNTHTRQKTVDAFPPQKSQGESHFIRSSFAQNQSQMSFHSGLYINSPILNSSNYNISCPSSKNSTQEAQFAQLVNSNNFNLLKKLLPVGSSKRYPTPIDQNDQRLSNKEDNRNSELIDMARETAVGSRPSCTSSEDQNINRKGKPIKPCTPTKNALNGDPNIIQKKPKKTDENKVTHVTRASAAMASGGSNQFRARMFAPKKNVDRENDVLH